MRGPSRNLTFLRPAGPESPILAGRVGNGASRGIAVRAIGACRLPARTGPDRIASTLRLWRRWRPGIRRLSATPPSGPASAGLYAYARAGDGDQRVLDRLEGPVRLEDEPVHGHDEADAEQG